jgi:hypothetical protein
MTRRVIVTIDPGKGRSGLSALDPDTGRVRAWTLPAPIGDRNLERARQLLTEIVSGARWAVAMERALHARWAFASPPTAAIAAWKALVADVAAASPGWEPGTVKRRRMPILTPPPSEWRRPLGIPRQPRAAAKAAALAVARRAIVGLDGEDAAEAVCLAIWAARQDRAGRVDWRPITKAPKRRRTR